MPCLCLHPPRYQVGHVVPLSYIPTQSYRDSNETPQTQRQAHEPNQRRVNHPALARAEAKRPERDSY